MDNTHKQSKFLEQMKIAKKVMCEDRDVLKMLAQSTEPDVNPRPDSESD